NPSVLALNGAYLLLRHDLTGARSEYERAIQKDPRNMDALAGLTDLDVRQGQMARARTRLDEQLSRAPSNPSLLMLSARLDLTASDETAAEAKLRRVIEIQPATLDAYTLLGGIYIRQKKLDQAKREFEALAARQDRPVGTNTVIGMILQLQN